MSRLEAANPPPPMRWAMSKVLGRWADAKRLAARRARFEAGRRRAGGAHVVEYFHQVDDGYSHLAAQLLGAFVERYDVRLICHLVPGPSGRNAPEPEMLSQLSPDDAARIAPQYKLDFPATSGLADAELVDLATRILANTATDSNAFAKAAPLVGEALWSGSARAMQTLAEQCGCADGETAQAVLAAGERQRAALGHYSGAMLHYGGEWYWGVDRLYHLENRLIELGVNRASGGQLAPRPRIETGPRRDDGSLTLEVYPSVRSPYSAVAFDAAVDLARASGVRLVVRPVLPMVMRGLPVTRTKGMYIFSDAAREARAHGQVDWGNYYEPIGEPVRRCYSLYPWAAEQGRGIEYLSAFMAAAFRQGVNTGTDAGLRRVVEAAGLPWEEAQTLVDNDEWQDQIEANRLAMYEFGLWGVPSFRLLDSRGETLLRAWGQDRLWLVSRAIQQALT